MTDHHTKQTTVTADAVVTREVNGSDVDMLRVPISSTRTDREGDRFAKEALEGMAEQIRNQQPNVFDNHGLAGSWMDAIPYDARETIGAQMDAEIEQADDGEHDLFAFVNPDGSHPEGERLVRQVEDEHQPVKFSVGFRILNSDPIEDDAGNEIGREFTDIDEMETSRVGIPANPDASVTQSVGAKSNGNALPGYQMHPMAQLLRAVAPDKRRGEPGTTAAKFAAPDESRGSCEGNDDCPDGEVCEDGECVDADEASASVADVRALSDELTALSATVGDLATTVRDLKDDGATKDECDGNDDCPDGEVCVEGECVDEDEVDDSTEPEDTDDATPVQDAVDAATDDDLREQIAELEDALDDGPGESDTGDPTTDKTDLTDEQRDEEPEETSETGDETTGADDWLTQE